MKKISLLIAGCIALSSCYKLDTTPYSQVSASTFWQNEDQALAGVLGCYNDLKKKPPSAYNFLTMDLPISAWAMILRAWAR